MLKTYAPFALAFTISTAGPVWADAASCTPIQAFTEQIMKSRKLSLDSKGCITHETDKLVAWICNTDAASEKAIDVMLKGSGRPASLRTMHVLEWSSSLEMKNDQNFGYNVSGFAYVNGAEAVSVRFTDYWRDDPNVFNSKAAPVDRIEIAKGPVGALSCAGAARPTAGAVLQAVTELHKPRPAAQTAQPAAAASEKK